MPYYEYKCPNGHQYEKRKPISEIDKVENCPECGEEGKRLFSTFMIEGCPTVKS
jgi:putative FmdB family regulatory protein